MKTQTTEQTLKQTKKEILVLAIDGIIKGFTPIKSFSEYYNEQNGSKK